MSTLATRTLLRPTLRSTTSSLPSRGSTIRTLIPLKQTLYEVTATSTGGGRDGTISSTPTDATAPLDLKLTVPKAIGGRGDVGHNPEQLFAAGYSACFLGAIQAAAAKQRKKEGVAQAVVHADVALGLPTGHAGYGLKVALRVEGVEDQAIIDAAHEMCPYSRALREGIVVDVQKA